MSGRSPVAPIPRARFASILGLLCASCVSSGVPSSFRTPVERCPDPPPPSAVIEPPRRPTWLALEPSLVAGATTWTARLDELSGAASLREPLATGPSACKPTLERQGGDGRWYCFPVEPLAREEQTRLTARRPTWTFQLGWSYPHEPARHLPVGRYRLRLEARSEAGPHAGQWRTLTRTFSLRSSGDESARALIDRIVTASRDQCPLPNASVINAIAQMSAPSELDPLFALRNLKEADYEELMSPLLAWPEARARIAEAAAAPTADANAATLVLRTGPEWFASATMEAAAETLAQALLNGAVVTDATAIALGAPVETSALLDALTARIQRSNDRTTLERLLAATCPYIVAHRTAPPIEALASALRLAGRRVSRTEPALARDLEAAAVSIERVLRTERSLLDAQLRAASGGAPVVLSGTGGGCSYGGHRSRSYAPTCSSNAWPTVEQLPIRPRAIELDEDPS